VNQERYGVVRHLKRARRETHKLCTYLGASAAECGTGEAAACGKANTGRECRAASEPVISHTKHDHGLTRNYLLGKVGDRINAILSACAWNLKKLWHHFVAHPLPVPAP